MRIPNLYVPTLTALFALTAAAGALAAEAPKEKAASAPVVTIMAKQKTGVVEGGKVIVPMMEDLPRIQNIAGEVHAIIQSESMSEQKALVRFRELEFPSFDVYVNQSLRGTLTRENLEAGIEVQIPRGVALDQIPLFQRLADSLQALVDKYKLPNAPKSALAPTAEQMLFSSRLAQNEINMSRSAYIILVVHGYPMRRPFMVTPRTSTEITDGMRRRWQFVDRQRRIMYKTTTDIDARDSALAAFTPVEFKAKISPRDAAGMQQVECALTDLGRSPISGEIQLIGSNGKPAASASPFKLKTDGCARAVFHVKAAPNTDMAAALTARALVNAAGVRFQVRKPVSP